MNAPSVAIILVNYNGLADTRECVASLEKITYPNWRLYIVDNASPNGDGSRVAAEFGGKYTVMELAENLGFAGGNNRAIERAIKEGADYVCLLNNDTVVEPNFLEPLVDVAEKNEKVAAVGGKIFYYAQRERVWFSTGIVGRWKMTICPAKEEKEGRCGSVCGCLMLIPVLSWKGLGGLEESTFMYYEDTDWCLRAAQRGFGFYYSPRSMIYHKVSASTKKLSNFSLYYLYRNQYWVIRRWYRGIRGVAARASFWWAFARMYVGAWRRGNQSVVCCMRLLYKHIRLGVMGKVEVPQ